MQVRIKAGQDFGTLARDYLGDGSKWNVIAAANPQYPVTWKGGIPYVTLKVGDPVEIPGVQDPTVDTTNDDFTFIPDPSPTPNDPLVVFPDLVVPAVVNPQPAPSPEPSYPEDNRPHFEPVVQTTETKKEEEFDWKKWLLIGGVGMVLFGKKLFGTGRSR